MKRFLKYTITLLVVIMLVSLTTNAQTIKRSKQKTEQATKPKQNNDSQKSNKTTIKSTKADKKKLNNSSSKQNKSLKAESHSNGQSAVSTEPTAYDVTFTCNVNDANMFIDGNDYGKPNGTRTLKTGPHQVKLVADGYKDYTTTIHIKAGNTSFDFNMTERPSMAKVEKIKVKGVSFDMIWVEGGTFTMGATAEQDIEVNSDERPSHRVKLSGFYISKYEVTQELWQAVMGSNPSKFTGDSRHPVEQVSWDDCQDFISKLNQLTGCNFRLPTEAEWEYAARGGNKSRGYKYAGSNNLANIAWYSDNSGGTTHPVGQKSSNELGLYDMSGNVCEWCQDRYGSYGRSSQTNPSGPSLGSERVYRGGNRYFIAELCRVSWRDKSTPDRNYSFLGLRLAATSL